MLANFSIIPRLSPEKKWLSKGGSLVDEKIDLVLPMHHIMLEMVVFQCKVSTPVSPGPTPGPSGSLPAHRSDGSDNGADGAALLHLQCAHEDVHHGGVRDPADGERHARRHQQDREPQDHLHGPSRSPSFDDRPLMSECGWCFLSVQDIDEKDIMEAKLHLVCYLVRVGKMHAEKGGKDKAGQSKVRRPYACAVHQLTVTRLIEDSARSLLQMKYHHHSPRSSKTLTPIRLSPA